jgi:hypothetical protein
MIRSGEEEEKSEGGRVKSERRSERERREVDFMVVDFMVVDFGGFGR